MKRGNGPKRSTPQQISAWRRRSKPLERGDSQLRRGGPLSRGRRKRRGHPTNEQIAAKQRTACFLARFSDEPCSGILRLCHLIKAERLRFYGVPEDSIWDERVVVNGCDGHHKQFDDSALNPLVIPRDELPPGVEEYAREWGMDWWLDREYGPRGAVA